MSHFQVKADKTEAKQGKIPKKLRPCRKVIKQIKKR